MCSEDIGDLNYLCVAVELVWFPFVHITSTSICILRIRFRPLLSLSLSLSLSLPLSVEMSPIFSLRLIIKTNGRLERRYRPFTGRFFWHNFILNTVIGFVYRHYVTASAAICGLVANETWEQLSVDLLTKSFSSG